MADYVITCVTKSARTNAGHQHITGVGIVTEWFTVNEIYLLMDDGRRFWTCSPSTSRLALVEKDYCCGTHTLRSRADAVVDNNLDDLRPCG